jgi:hypothetical protein
MSIIYQVKRNDTAAIVDTLLDSAGIAVNLTGAGVLFHVVDRFGTSVINRSATGPGGGALDTTGKVQFVFMASEVSTAGAFFAEWQVTFTNGQIQTWPQNDQAILIMYPDLL